MHVNRRKPNILQDKIVGARSDLKDRDSHGNVTAKRNLKQHKDYRHCKDAQILKAETGN